MIVSHNNLKRACSIGNIGNAWRVAEMLSYSIHSLLIALTTYTYAGKKLSFILVID